MANAIGLNGGQPQKATRFAPIYTGRWSSGIWTNRSPLRDANTSRFAEKYYGPSGDALIAGSNVEITNRLTLARRAGNSLFDANTYSTVDNFESFRMFGPNTERINVMIDQANALYSQFNGVKTLVWTKSTGASESYMQSVGNSLYFGNGVDNKKWLQSLQSWSAAARWGTASSPFMSTFIIDTNGNIQQLTQTILPVTNVAVSVGVMTITINQSVANVLSKSLQVQFPAGMAATWLSGKTVSITGVSGSTFTAVPPSGAPGTYSAGETNKIAIVVQGGTPISGGVTPTWSATVPSSSNNFAGGTTDDGTVRWTNRGLPTENWGLVAPTAAPTVAVGSSRVAWVKNTFYSLAGIIIDSNGNVQQVTTAGLSGGSAPTWATVVGNTTTDGSITWTVLQTAASLTWIAHHTYAAGALLKANAAGVNCLFQLAPITTPYLNGTINYYWYNRTASGAVDLGWSGIVGAPINFFAAPFGQPAAGFPNASGTAQSLNWSNGYVPGGLPGPLPNVKANIINGAGEITGSTDLGHSIGEWCITGTIHIRNAGQYSFNLNHDDGAFIGFGQGPAGYPQKISGSAVNTPGSNTVYQGYPIIAGNNNSGSYPTDGMVVNFPVAGDYPFEIDFSNWKDTATMILTCNGNQICPTPDISGATQPVWPAWNTLYAPGYPSVTESAGQYVWNNLGPIADYSWLATVNFTLPNTTIIDSNGNTEAPYRAGLTGSTAPTFQTGFNQLTNDNPNLIWINKGQATAPPSGTLSTFNGGWVYGIALVNSLDSTVSNLSTLSSATGNFIGAQGITIAAGSGLDVNLIDPQADYVAIFRSTDGLTTPFLITGTGNSLYTVPLSTYLTSGYTDTATDVQLNNEIQAATTGQNTPPPAGAINLTYHLNRVFFSVGNVVYWTSGPDTPVGNGVNGVAPTNYDSFPSLVERIVPTAIGALVFTVSDIFLIQGQGTTSNPIQGGQPYLQGVGILSYNALAINGSIIGFFTTDNQFVILDPSSGVSYAGFPIGDRLRLNNGQAGTSWNASNVYVAWHVDGEDQAWYVADGANGWYRLMATPAPETGYTWSPFATITGGVKAVKSVEISPGVHKLLLGPTGTGSVLQRDLTSFTDNGTAYPANAVIGSMVLAQPGQIAEVSFVTVDTVKVGTPITLAVIMDEALPYYTGPFEVLKNYENDPPGLPTSSSILGQRFYFAELQDEAAVCRHMQVQVNLGSDNVQNELLSLTIFGAFLQEK